MKKIIFGLVIILVFFGNIQKISAAFQVTDNDFIDSEMTANDKWIAWSYWDGNDFEIVVYNKQNNSKTQLTNNTEDDFGAQLSENNVVWMSGRWGGDSVDFEVMLYKLDLGILKIITNNSNNDIAPTISQNLISWRSDDQIYLYDLNTEQVRQLASYGVINGPWVDQGRIVWTVNWNNQWSVFVYNFFNNSYAEFLKNSNEKANIRFSYPYLTWSQHDGSDSEIFLFNISTNSLLQLTNNSYNDQEPSVFGGKVVWTGFIDNGPPQIFLFNELSTEQLTFHNYNSEPFINEYGIIWTEYDGYDYETIFSKDGNRIINITNNDLSDNKPILVGNDIVLIEYDGHDTEIFIYNILSLNPSQFLSQIQNAPNWLRLRDNHNLTSNIIKTAPNGWALKVLNTADLGGNDVDVDGYRWYQVYDPTDNTTGWIAAKNLTDGTIYLDYNPTNQSELKNKAEIQLNTAYERKPVILNAVNTYYSENNSNNSLYGGGGGRNNSNNFQLFISGSNFVKELILSIIAQESGGYEFNNEQCSSRKDGGIGIMQITTYDYKGWGSGLDNQYLHANDCAPGWAGNFSKYYSNALQGIYANIKDGFRALQDKYRTQCFEEYSHGLYFNCYDIRRILTIWGYNGFGDKSGAYLNRIADKLESLGSYFSGVMYNNSDQFVQKLREADREKILALVYSPVTLRVIDSQNRVTGVVGEVIKEEIPNSLYEAKAESVAIFFPKNSYIYRLVGKENGVYGFDISYAHEGTTQIFRAVDLPILQGEIHQYAIDWDKISRCEKGAAVLEIDKEGDGIFDRTASYDCELTDIESPQITFSPIQNEYILNSQLQVQFSTTDSISGISSTTASINGEAIANGQTITLIKPGINVIRVVATDNEGNEAVLEKLFNVLYNFGGFLPPIKTDGSGVYNQGRTLPVKFQLMDVNGNYIQNAVAYLYLAKIDDNIIGNDEIPLSVSAADINNQFRYDVSANQYIYNLSTDALTFGAWQIKAVLDSGQIYSAVISIR